MALERVLLTSLNTEDRITRLSDLIKAGKFTMGQNKSKDVLKAEERERGNKRLRDAHEGLGKLNKSTGCGTKVLILVPTLIGVSALAAKIWFS